MDTRRVVGYKIVSAYGDTILSDLVTRSLREGWQPWSTVIIDTTGLLIQVLVRYEE